MKQDFPEADAAWLAARLFYQGLAGRTGLSAREIANEINQRTGASFTREGVYPLLRRAFEMDFIQLTPPKKRQVVDQLRVCFPALRRARSVHVVPDSGAATWHTEEHHGVAATAASLVVKLAREISEERSTTKDPTPVVGLGLGPGRASLDFARHLARALDNTWERLRFDLFALTAGGLATRPEQSPSGFFNLLHDSHVRNRYGLFASTLMPASAFKRVLTEHGVREAVERKSQVDVVVTGMGDMSDEHDLLAEQIKGCKPRPTAAVLKEWLGNVQYRPFTARGPVVERGKELRAVTLFELEEFRTMSQTRGRHVVLMVRPCNSCGHTRAKALVAMLDSPALQVFSDLVLDERTAMDAVNLKRAEAEAHKAGAAPAGRGG